jgi:hypothetical protein
VKTINHTPIDTCGIQRTAFRRQENGRRTRPEHDFINHLSSDDYAATTLQWQAKASSVLQIRGSGAVPLSAPQMVGRVGAKRGGGCRGLDISLPRDFLDIL